LNPVDHVMATDTLSAQQKADILGNTAARVLKITG